MNLKQKLSGMADEYVAHGYGCDGDTSKDSFIKGAQAMQKLLSEMREDFPISEYRAWIDHPDNAFNLMDVARWAFALRTAQVQALKEEIGVLNDSSLVHIERDLFKRQRDESREMNQEWLEGFTRQKDEIKALRKELAEAKEVIENLKMVCRRLSAAKSIESRDKIAKQCIDLFRGSVLRDKARKFLGGE